MVKTGTQKHSWKLLNIDGYKVTKFKTGKQLVSLFKMKSDNFRNSFIMISVTKLDVI